MTGQRGRERGRERGPKPRSRAGIAGTVYPRGKKWAYAVTLAPDPLTGERRRDARSGFDTEKAAWDALIEANNQLRSNTYVKNSTTTVGQFLDQWLATISISVKPTTHSNYRNYADYYVIPIIGDRKLQDITTDTITSLYTHLLHRGRRRGNSNQLMHEHWKRATGRQATPSAREHRSPPRPGTPSCSSCPGSRPAPCPTTPSAPPRPTPPTTPPSPPRSTTRSARRCVP